MALTRVRLLFRLITLAAITVGAPVIRVQADSVAPPAPGLPSLGSFARLVTNGQADELSGVYAEDLFASQVVQQPFGDPAYVSSQHNVLTAFRSAAQLGSTGLLARNYRAGSTFAELQPGQPIHLVYGDGHTVAYVVTTVLRYRAVQPNSAYSSFVDLLDGSQTSAAALYREVYGRPGALILQTCIEADGISTWGRLFIIAEPYVRRLSTLRSGPIPD